MKAPAGTDWAVAMVVSGRAVAARLSQVAALAGRAGRAARMARVVRVRMTGKS